MRKFDKFVGAWWQIIAISIAMFVAGPEIYVFAEGMVVIEIIGAATFVFMYVVGFKLYFHNAWNAFYKFENRYHFFLPSLRTIRNFPGLLYYAIPWRSSLYGIFALASFLSFRSIQIVFV